MKLKLFCPLCTLFKANSMMGKCHSLTDHFFFKYLLRKPYRFKIKNQDGALNGGSDSVLFFFLLFFYVFLFVSAKFSLVNLIFSLPDLLNIGFQSKRVITTEFL